ncbi:hypothetical protein PENANT_c293G01454 [Penicillium antarcticum]|uniref:Uncharacterized protein n=1 Tax=Penicillium antarcticum TaxID=416450 RepID=A0A1V6NVE5_9EURO|nr:hypothetical protein PENANT_c293G01454 [Penicillium antarcticum]
MSELSQSSNTGPFSQLLSDTPDLTLLFSDNQSLVYEPFDSQRTSTSLPRSQFITPVSAPLALERGGPPNKQFWVIRTEMNKDEFDAKRTSDAWDDFDQVAHFITEQQAYVSNHY